MKTQCHDDLVQAQAELEVSSRSWIPGMRRQFQEKFAEIRAANSTRYSEIVRRRPGTLELMEDEDILEAGIQIIAQPPGKHRNCRT